AGANAAPPADLAVWRATTGEWWVLGGQGSQSVTQGWGTAGDTPVPGDYDGDGKTDFAVWRASNGNWYMLTALRAGLSFRSERRATFPSQPILTATAEPTPRS